MRRIHVSFVLLSLAVLILSGHALAQGGQRQSRDRELLQMELERTDQILEQAEAMANASDNPQAALAVQQAKKLQQQAWDDFNLGTPSGDAKARVETLKAREFGRISLATGRQTEQNDAVIQRVLEHAQELMDRAADALSGSGNTSLQGVYDAAKDNLSRAWEFYQQKKYKPALKLATQVQNTAEKILSAASGTDQNPENFERRRDNVSRMMDQARLALEDCKSASAAGYMTDAQKAFDLADDLYAQTRVPAALQALRRARDLASSATRECQGNDALLRRYERLKTLADQLTEQLATVSGSTRDDAQKLISQANEQLVLAQGYMNSGKADQGLAALQAAQLALRQAQALITPVG